MRIWVDGCFDFFHHGHAGALNQARALGDALVVGIHTDEEILANKGPVVMHLPERELAVDACRWTTEEVPGAPYVTDPEFMARYDCEYVAHGDDITTDANGNDCYQQMKDAHRFLEFKRTPNISTTDLIGRMLSNSTQHHREADHASLTGPDAQARFALYARAADAKAPYAGVWCLAAPAAPSASPRIEQFVEPRWPARFDHVAYTEGAFDLFHCGHIEFLRGLRELAGPQAAVVVGLRADAAVNARLADGRPIMNVFERALCVLQCKYVDGVLLNVPYAAPADWLDELQAHFRLPVTLVALGAKSARAPEAHEGVYELAARRGVLASVPAGKYVGIRTQTIVDRVLANRAQYEERQRKKGVKADNERVLEAEERAGRA